ncbi:MAG: virulence factor [bacterium]|nr:virulence factor [bacterium]MCY4192774.1 virulence factor [bacterium]MCY4271828.1 virulence factor [bacterium]
MSRRRGDNDSLVVICWRDIPAQVNAGSGSSKIQRILPRRFQRAIDRAAMAAGKTGASQYIGEWRRKVLPGEPGEPEAAVLRAATEIERSFPPERLKDFVAAGGWDPENATENPLEATP